MSGSIDIPTLIFLALAVSVLLKLWSVLGRKTGDESTRYERYKAQRTSEANAAGNAGGKIVTLPRRERADAAPADPVNKPDADRDLRFTKFAAGDAAVATGLIEIGLVDAAFEPAEFMKGAKTAYEMIVMAFAEGNRKALVDLLDAEAYQGFEAAITEREARKETIEQSFVGIKSANMVEADRRGAEAHVTIKFLSELISVTKNAAGEIIAGDAMRIREVTDIWTFARTIASGNPNWRLVGTQAAN